MPNMPPRAETADILWFLPTHGDGRYLGTEVGARHITLGYLSQISAGRGRSWIFWRSAADGAVLQGFLGHRFGDGSADHELTLPRRGAPWSIRTVNDRTHGCDAGSAVGRSVLINVVAGGDPVEMHGDGVWFDHGERYKATAEYLTVWRALMQGQKVDFNGGHVRVEGGKLLFPPVPKPYPPLYFGGSSDAGQDVAAEHCDVYLTWGERPTEVGEKLARAEQRAAERGRTLSFGIRLHVVVRETAGEAWREADALIQHVDGEAIALSQRTFARFNFSPDSSAWRGCTMDAVINWRSARTFSWVSSAAAPAPRLSATRSRWPRGCGIHGTGDRPLHSVGLSALAGVLSLRGTRLSAAASEADDGTSSRPGAKCGSVRVEIVANTIAPADLRI